MQKILAVLIPALVLTSMLTACGGGGAKSRQEVRTTTVGRELMDLEQAKNQGAITQDEYEKLKKKIIKGN
ncbi:SHOCT domain-containing protein [Desulfovibrio inopinatus]|uniref:SHOCT domain-containing protein n=1 Tax=Desulfovibrio inopinatus TaxID=102109 RepID=UPI0003F7870C|nr:SHOCT domain-containing protein [Desulfovibrio inopinatus]